MDQLPQWVGAGGGCALAGYLILYAIPQMRKDWRDSATACRAEREELVKEHRAERVELVKAFRDECALQREHDKTVLSILRGSGRQIRGSAD